MQLLHDYALTSDWLISPLLKGGKKGRGGTDQDRRKKQPFVAVLRGGLEGKTLASSHQELKQKRLINRARQIRSPCTLNTSPSRGLPLVQTPNTSAFSHCCHLHGSGKNGDDNKHTTAFFFFVPLSTKSRGERVPSGLEWSALFVLQKHDLVFFFVLFPQQTSLFYSEMLSVGSLHSTADYGNILLNGSRRTIDGECLPKALCLSPKTRCQFNSVDALHFEFNVFALSILTPQKCQLTYIHTYILCR